MGEYISASLVGRLNWCDAGWVVGCVLPVSIVTLAVCLVSWVVQLAWDWGPTPSPPWRLPPCLQRATTKPFSTISPSSLLEKTNCYTNKQWSIRRPALRQCLPLGHIWFPCVQSGYLQVWVVCVWPPSYKSSYLFRLVAILVDMMHPPLPIILGETPFHVNILFSSTIVIHMSFL